MSNDEQTIIFRAYTEIALAAKEQGLSGVEGAKAVLAATAKLASRILGKTVTPEDVMRQIA